MQEFRHSLPADTKVVVCKNTLMRIAADKVDGWSDLKKATNVSFMLPLEAVVLCRASCAYPTAAYAPL